MNIVMLYIVIVMVIVIVNVMVAAAAGHFLSLRTKTVQMSESKDATKRQ